jgi:3-phosphoshikimate 1-carboxyvinyltransferase
VDSGTVASAAAGGRALVGTVTVPGDKSISHRAVVLAGLAAGRSVVRGANLGHDVLATCRLLSALGARCTLDRDNGAVEVEGCGWEGLVEPGDVLDAGNSATTLRLLLGVCAAVALGAALTGDATLRRRPMLRVVEPLRAMGARIDGRAGGDRAPLWVRGGGLRAIAWRTPVASAQVKSAVLLAGLRATGTTSVTEPAPSRDHTERMLAAAGVDVGRSGRTVTISGPGDDLPPVDRRVPGDFSAAAYLLTAAALVPGSELTVAGVGLNPTRTGALDALVRMGADVTVERSGDDSGEPYGNVTARAAGELTATTISGDEVPRLIDEVPVLAVAATQAAGTTVIAGARELRVKESDRIDAIVAGLRALGASVEPRPDGLVIRGPTPLRSGTVDARGDHRIALASAVAGMISGARVEVAGWGSVETSFPGWTEIVARARGASA